VNLLKRRLGAFNGEEVGVIMEEEEVEGGGGAIFLILLSNLFFLIPTLIPKELDFLSSFSINHHLCSNMTYI